MIKRLSFVITSFMPGLAIADDAAIDFVGAALDLIVQLLLPFQNSAFLCFWQ